MKIHLILMVAILLIAGGIYALRSKTLKQEPETFTNSETCPTSATRTNDGRIVVEPGHKSFSTLSDYVAYLSGLYANGSKCIPPKVSMNNQPTLGIFGGLGNGNGTPDSPNRESATRSVLDMDFSEQTSAKTSINKLDDYEYTRVNEVERDSANRIEKDQKNHLLKSRVLDWANLPFNSETRAQKEDEFISGRMETAYREPKSGVFFNTMNGKTLEPPDVDAALLREQKLLASYRPTDLGNHIIDSESEAVARLVNEEYGSDPNWEPVVSKVGENQWEVTELRPKPRKERYEDSETIRLSTAEQEGKVQPRASISINDQTRNDPFFDKGGLGDRDNDTFWQYDDFRKWTPGLERMFAPTTDNRRWY